MWTLVQNITAPADTDSVEFGFAIEVQGHTMVISAPRTGAPIEQNSLDITNEPTSSIGAVYIYTYNGVEWVLAQTLTQLLYPGASKPVQNFGQSVALSADLSTLVVGAPYKGMLLAVWCIYLFLNLTFYLHVTDRASTGGRPSPGGK